MRAVKKQKGRHYRKTISSNEKNYMLTTLCTTY